MAEQTVAGTTFSTGDAAQAFPLGGPVIALALQPGQPASLPDAVVEYNTGLICIQVPDSAAGLVYVGDATSQTFSIAGTSTWSVNSNCIGLVRFLLDPSAAAPVDLQLLLAATGR